MTITGFMGKADCESAIENMKLTNGLAWGYTYSIASR